MMVATTTQTDGPDFSAPDSSAPDASLNQNNITLGEHEQVPEERSIEAISEDGMVEEQRQSTTASVRRCTAITQNSADLRPLKKLYDRDDAISIIRKEYQRVMGGEATTMRNDNEAVVVDNRANLVVIRGASGVGKTSVALSIQDTVRRDGGFILTWKFDDFNKMETEATFDDGLADLCQQILGSAKETREKLSETIRAAGAVECATLLDMIPALKVIIGDKEEFTGGLDSVESAGKLIEVLTNFIHCFRKARLPFVILLDDLEFIDPYSCVMLTQILRGFETGGVLCLATVGPQPNEGVDNITNNSSKKVRITNVELENLQEDQLNAMVADMLHVTKDISVPMTKFLHHHSRGNPLFATELLRLMVETGTLKYDAEQKTWNCEEPQRDLVEQYRHFDVLITYRLTLASEEVQDILKVAACFGNKVDAKVLEMVVDSPPQFQLKAAASLGWLVVVDENNGIYQFAHNGVQRGAYGLIPKEERESLHVANAKRLLRKLDDRQRHKHVSVVLGQIKMGIGRFDNQEERSVMAGVCLEGSQKAVEWSGFAVALECLELGISLLGDNCWREHYDLSLALYNNAAECGHALGSFPRALELVDVVLRNARVFDDKLQAYFTQLYVLGSKYDNRAALQIGVDVLGQLGVTVPLNPGPKELKREISQMLRFMKGKTPERLLRLPNMTDKRVASVVQVVNLIMFTAIESRPHLGTILVLRAMRLTATHGLCAISSCIFGLYGVFACGYSKNIDEGTRYGDAALQLLGRFNAKEWAPRVYVVVYGIVYLWTKDIRYCIEKLSRAQSSGFESGDNQFAMLSGSLRLEYMVALGEPIST